MRRRGMAQTLSMHILWLSPMRAHVSRFRSAPLSHLSVNICLPFCGPILAWFADGPYQPVGQHPAILGAYGPVGVAVGGGGQGDCDLAVAIPAWSSHTRPTLFC